MRVPPPRQRVRRAPRSLAAAPAAPLSWRRVAPLSPFVLAASGARPRHATLARLAWDAEGIYARFDYRVERPRGAEPEWSAWSPTLLSPADFHVTERFGVLELVG